MSIDDALDAYLLQLEADGRSRHTIGQARRHVGLFARWAGCAGACGNVRKIGHQDVARFLTSTEARTRPDGGLKKASSVNALRSSLRAFFAYAHASGLTETNPARLVKRAKTGAPPPRTIPVENLGKLFRALAGAETVAERRDHAMFTVLRHTGIRVGALVGLQVEDVDLGGQAISIRSKGDVEQVLPVSDEVAAALRDAMGNRLSGPVFTNADGIFLTTRHVARRLAQWCDRCEISRISPHRFRHSFATNLYQRTGDIRLTQSALGHRSVASTIVYAQVDKERLRSAIAG